MNVTLDLIKFDEGKRILQHAHVLRTYVYRYRYTVYRYVFVIVRCNTFFVDIKAAVDREEIGRRGKIVQLK